MYALACPKCENTDLKPKGRHSDTKRQRWLCSCGYKTTNPDSKRIEAQQLEVVTEHQLQRNLRQTRQQLREATEQAEQLRNELGIVKNLGEQSLTPPRWLKEKRKRQDIGIATAMLSDTHFDEVVDPGEVNWVNAYNREIAQLRLQTFFQNTVRLSADHMGGIDLQGLVLALGGDMVTGNIHEELADTNDGDGIMETVVFWAEQISAGIELLLDQFNTLFVPCVTGNHGRNSRKPRHKGRNCDNFDWLIYKLVEKHFKDCNQIKFDIPDGPASRWDVYDTRYHMEHGDQGFNGGNGIAGIWSPIMRGNLRLQQREQAVNTPYDVLLIGHFHQLKFGGHDFVMNGSLKGLDEYASDGKFGFERPQQAFWITDPRHGMTIKAPILVESSKENWRQQPQRHRIGG